MRTVIAMLATVASLLLASPAAADVDSLNICSPTGVNTLTVPESFSGTQFGSGQREVKINVGKRSAWRITAVCVQGRDESPVYRNTRPRIKITLRVESGRRINTYSVAYERRSR